MPPQNPSMAGNDAPGPENHTPSGSRPAPSYGYPPAQGMPPGQGVPPAGDIPGNYPPQPYPANQGQPYPFQPWQGIQQPPPPKKSHKKAIITTIVVVLAVAVIGALMWWLVGGRGSGAAATNSPKVPTDAFADGTREQWSVTAEATEEDYLLTSDTYMVLLRMDGPDSGSLEMTTWDISGDDAEQVWSGEIAAESDLSESGILGRYLVPKSFANYQDANDPKIYDITTGESAAAPWEAPAQVETFGGELALACRYTPDTDTGECSGYDDELNELWNAQTDLANGQEQLAVPAVVSADGEVKALSCTSDKCQITDFTSGELTNVDFDVTTDRVYPTATRDGWFIDYQPVDGAYSEAYIGLDGKLVDEVPDLGAIDIAPVLRVSNGGTYKVADIQAIQASNTEPANGVTVLSGSGTECQDLEINGNSVGEDPISLWYEQDGACTMGAFPPMTASPSGHVLAIGYGTMYEPGNNLFALLNTETGDVVWQAVRGLGTDYGNPNSLSLVNFGRLVEPDKLLVIEVNGEETTITAYRPGVVSPPGTFDHPILL